MVNALLELGFLEGVAHKVICEYARNILVALHGKPFLLCVFDQKEL